MMTNSTRTAKMRNGSRKEWKRYSAEDVATIKLLRSQGYSFPSIALELGRTTGAVYNKYLRITDNPVTPVYSTDKTITIKTADIKKKLSDFSIEEIVSYLYDNNVRMVDGKFVKMVPIPVFNKSFAI